MLRPTTTFQPITLGNFFHCRFLDFQQQVLAWKPTDSNEKNTMPIRIIIPIAK